LGSRFSFSIGLRLFISRLDKSVRDAFSGFRGNIFSLFFLSFGLGFGLSSWNICWYFFLLLRNIYRFGDRLLLLFGLRLHILLLHLLHVSFFLILLYLVVFFVLLVLLGVLHGRMATVLRHAIPDLIVSSL
jgi:hypothetical protein